MTKLNDERRQVKGIKFGPNSNPIKIAQRVYLPPDLAMRIDAFADEHNTTRAEIQRTAMEIGMRYLERKSKEKKDG